jgi:hypothetical protein
VTELEQFGAQFEDFEKAGVGVRANDEARRNRKAIAQQFAEVGAFTPDQTRVAGTYFVQRKDGRSQRFSIDNARSFISSSPV